MQLKKYQERAICEVKTFLELLAVEQAKANKHPSMDAWDEARKQLPLRTDYQERKNGLGLDVPRAVDVEREGRELLAGVSARAEERLRGRGAGDLEPVFSFPESGQANRPI